jgi:hypothetical protein
MKKIIILSVAFIAISLASCSHKDRVCSCSQINSAPGSTAKTYTIVYKNSTSKNATAACMSLNVQENGNPTTDTRTCTLK